MNFQIKNSESLRWDYITKKINALVDSLVEHGHIVGLKIQVFKVQQRNFDDSKWIKERMEPLTFKSKVQKKTTIKKTAKAKPASYTYGSNHKPSQSKTENVIWEIQDIVEEVKPLDPEGIPIITEVVNSVESEPTPIRILHHDMFHSITSEGLAIPVESYRSGDKWKLTSNVLSIKEVFDTASKIINESDDLSELNNIKERLEYQIEQKRMELKDLECEVMKLSSKVVELENKVKSKEMVSSETQTIESFTHDRKQQAYEEIIAALRSENSRLRERQSQLFSTIVEKEQIASTITKDPGSFTFNVGKAIDQMNKRPTFIPIHTYGDFYDPFDDSDGVDDEDYS